MAVGLAHGPGQDGVGLVVDGAVGEEVVRLAAGVEGIEGLGGDELGDGDGVVGSATELVQLGGIDDDVPVLGVLVAGDYSVALDLAV